MTTQNTYEIVAMSAEIANRLRATGGDIYIADEVPGYPCRQCLRDAEIGEELVLVSYTPFASASPYRSASPIFLHRAPCGPPNSGPELPAQLTQRQLSVRSFDVNEMVIDSAVIDGASLAETLEELLGNDEALRLHIHNASRGCYAATVTRVD